MAAFHLPRERRPNYRFGFTAFADTMFQLLIFFILSSGMTPFSLITLKTAAAMTEGGTGDGGGDGSSPAAAVAPPELALWTIEGGELLISGQRFPYDMLPALAEALGTPAAPADVVLIVRGSAQVQDVATVLSALQAANVGSVRIAAEGG
ncbi:ExbD/TolR family protein [Tabrizicola aquatica]|uniref:ExbD/TolR family protein n=1 Tax=Tabrizicola aquatica TaxID=909926 RepID=UPI000CD2AF54|nr:biopolymer transporter ExbD [Tabrizicola aquatica]